MFTVLLALFSTSHAATYNFTIRVPVHLQNLSPEVEKVVIQCAVCKTMPCPSGTNVRGMGSQTHVFLPGAPRALNETYEIPVSVQWPDSQYDDLFPPRTAACKLLLQRVGSGGMYEPDGNGGWNSRAGPEAGPYHPNVDRMIPSGYYPP
jgi:hypothetical protein